MTTWTIQSAAPAAGIDAGPQADFTDTGLRIDDTVTDTGTDRALLDYMDGSTTALKIGNLLVELQRGDTRGLIYRAFDGSSTYIKPNL